MRVLFINNDELAVNLVKPKIEALGHEVLWEKIKKEGVERLNHEAFDVLFIDPEPLTTPALMIATIRRQLLNFPYIFVISSALEEAEAIAAGANSVFPKPLDPSLVEEKMRFAETMVGAVQNYGDDSIDFPSAGGVIARSAFNQLFLSAMDRGNRYAERAYVLRIYIADPEKISSVEGPYALDYAAAKMSQHLVQTRRQSDIIGQTGKYEYSLLLQRPAFEAEPEQAANRFAESLAQMRDVVQAGQSEMTFIVDLLALPQGGPVVEHRVVLDA